MTHSSSVLERPLGRDVEGGPEEYGSDIRGTSWEGVMFVQEKGMDGGLDRG